MIRGQICPLKHKPTLSGGAMMLSGSVNSLIGWGRQVVVIRGSLIYAKNSYAARAQLENMFLGKF